MLALWMLPMYYMYAVLWNQNFAQLIGLLNVKKKNSKLKDFTVVASVFQNEIQYVTFWEKKSIQMILAPLDVFHVAHGSH